MSTGSCTVSTLHHHVLSSIVTANYLRSSNQAFRFVYHSDFSRALFPTSITEISATMQVQQSNTGKQSARTMRGGGSTADEAAGSGCVSPLLVKPYHLHADVLNLALGVTQHRLSLRQHLLVTSRAAVVRLNHILRTLLHLQHVQQTTAYNSKYTASTKVATSQAVQWIQYCRRM